MKARWPADSDTVSSKAEDGSCDFHVPAFCFFAEGLLEQGRLIESSTRLEQVQMLARSRQGLVVSSGLIRRVSGDVAKRVKCKLSFVWKQALRAVGRQS